MSKCFVDTSGWGAWANVTDQYHQQAIAAFDRQWNDQNTLITTSFVLLELTGLFNHFRFSKKKQLEFMENLLLDPSIEVIQIDRQLEVRAWHLWRERQDKLWTLVDCSSFVIMEELGISLAITSDQHFTQAGFARLIN